MNNYDIFRQEQKEESRIKILEAAAYCFGENGYTKTSIKDIADRAKVSHGLIGKYFNTKENLLSQTYIYVTKSVYPIPDQSLDLHERIELLIKQSIGVMNDNPVYFNFFLKIMKSSDLPEDYLKARLELFTNAPIYNSIEDWKKRKNLADISAYDYFIQFLQTVYLILNMYKSFSVLEDGGEMDTHFFLKYLVDMIEKEVKTIKEI